MMANEKRLIDANALMDVIKQHEYRLATEQGSIDYGMFTLGIQQAVDEQPTIDAVPVVRCSECKHHRDKNEQEQQYLAEDTLICTSQDATEDCWNAVWPNHFCSCGERKEGVD